LGSPRRVVLVGRARLIFDLRSPASRDGVRRREVHTLVFAVVCLTLWLGPVLVVVAVKLIAGRSDIELRRLPPPDEIDYNRW